MIFESMKREQRKRELFSKAVRTTLYISRNSIETSGSRRVSSLPRRIIARKSRHFVDSCKNLSNRKRESMYSLRNIQFPPPFPFVSFSFPFVRAKNTLAEWEERTNRWQISFYSFPFYLSIWANKIFNKIWSIDRFVSIYRIYFYYLIRSRREI